MAILLRKVIALELQNIYLKTENSKLKECISEIRIYLAELI